MCDICKLKTINDSPMELQNKQQTLATIDGGFILVDICLNRYVSVEDDLGIHELILEVGSNTSSSDMSLASQHIPIKYCPFCGEKL